MIGLMIIGFFALYLFISAFVVGGAARWAKRNGRSAWKWGGLAVFVMYNLVFWDFIPTLIAHKYNCATEAGFWVYKTPEQWKKENPGVVETLVTNKGAPSARQDTLHGFTDTYFLNQRIHKVVKQNRTSSILPIYRLEQEIVDVQSNHALARYTDFFSGYGNLGTGGDGSWRVLKVWLMKESCGREDHPQHQFYVFEEILLGDKK